MHFDYDLFVIGGGSGGVRAARIASAEGGAKVGLAEESRMGGTCVIRGCVPKKLMVFASGFPDAIADAHAYGWNVTAGGFDWPKFRDHLEVELDRLEAAYRKTLENAGVTIHDSRAVLQDAHTVVLANGERFVAKHVLVATGGRPFVPEIPGAELAVTSNEMFHLEALPKRALVVGGGYIASEFACILNGLGVEVSQYYRGAQILRGFDDEARGHVATAMQASGVTIHCGTDVLRLEKTDTGFRATTAGGTIEAQNVVVGTGPFQIEAAARGRVGDEVHLAKGDMAQQFGPRDPFIVRPPLEPADQMTDGQAALHLELGEAAGTRAGERGLRHIGRDDLGDRRAERLVPLRKDHGDRQRLLPRRAAHAPDAGTAAGLFDHSDRLDDQVEDMRVAEEGGFAIDQRIDHPPRQRRIAAV